MGFFNQKRPSPCWVFLSFDYGMKCMFCFFTRGGGFFVF